MPISNANLEDEDCSDISDWADADHNSGVSTQENDAPVADPVSTSFKLSSGNIEDSYALRTKSLGSVFGTRVIISINLYCDILGTLANVDTFNMVVNLSSELRLRTAFASDGVFVDDGVSFNEVGTNLVVQDTWQEWTFDVDISAGAENAVVDVYLDNILQASDVDCSKTGTYTEGDVLLVQQAYGLTNRLTYVDWLKIGDGFAPSIYIPRIIMF